MRTKIAYSLLLAVVIFLGAAAARVAAQNAAPGGQPPGGGFPGMGMFGTEEERAKMAALMQRGQGLRYLDDADVRTEIGITPEQEQKITELRERGTNMGARIRDEIQAQMQGRMRPDMTDEERAAVRLEAMQMIGDAIRNVSADVEKMLGEAETILTPQQKEKLAVVTRERSALEQSTGGLAILLTAQAREACALTRDQVDQIRVLLKGLASDGQAVRDRLFGAGKELTQEDMQSDKYKEFQTQRQDMIAKTREKILSIFGAEQREKVEKFLAAPRGPGGRMRGMGGMGGMRSPAGGPPATPPAPPAPAPGAPAPPQ